MNELKKQLSFIKEQKNNYKNAEKNLLKKLNLKEKEVNDLRTILNTNISIRSQISTINHDAKEEDNSKDIKEIIPYNESLNLNKKYYRPKSLTLIERKLSSYNNIKNKRNLSNTNNSNKSYYDQIISKQKIKSMSRKKNEYKWQTIANIFSGSCTKRTKEDNYIKIINNIIKPYYSNYNSINSFRGKKLDKSDSRSLVSKRIISKCKNNESNNSKNKSDINSHNIRKENDSINNNKNKILINYNTNIINTNVSIDKLTIKQKMKEIKKSIDEKIFQITRNKKNNIRKTISAIYKKRDESPFMNRKIKTNRETSFKYNNIYINNKNNSNKLNIKSRKKYKINNYNSNIFKQKLQNFTIQHKNDKNGKKIKIKFQNKNNSMINIKNDIINKNIDKLFSIQAYTGKKSVGYIYLYKNNNDKISKKNSSIFILNNKMPINKNKDVEYNNKTIKNNRQLLGLKNKIDINSINYNKCNSSLRKIIFNKCISCSNIS